MKRHSSDLFILNVAAIISIGIVGAMAAWNLLAINRNQEYAEWVNHSEEVIAVNNKILTSLVSAETNVRGMAYTWDPSYLPVYYQKRSELSGHVKQLRVLTGNDLLQQRRMDSVERLISHRLLLLDQIIELVNDSVPRNSEITLRIKEGTGVMNDFLAVNFRIGQYENDRLSTRKKNLEREYQLSRTLLVSGFIIFVVLLLVAYLDLRRQMLKRIESEKELFISRDWFSKTMMSMGDGVIATDASGIVTYLNHTAEELTGWRKSDAAGKPLDFVFEIVNEYTRLPVANPVKKALSERKVILLSNHTLLICKDKTQKYIDDSAAPILNDEGNLVGAVLIFRDISDQVIVRKRLLENENLLKKIVDNTGAIISIRDKEGRFTMVNTAFEKAAGKKAHEIIGKTSAALVSEEENKHLVENFRKVLEAKDTIITEETVSSSVDNIRHQYISVRFPFKDADGNITGVCSISTDITAQKKYQQETHDRQLQASIHEGKVQYRQLTDRISEMFFTVDVYEKIVYWNRACERQTGKRSVEVIGKSFDHVFSEAETKTFRENFLIALKQQQSQTFFIEHQNSAEVKSFKASAYPAPDGISVLMTDITTEKKSQKETLQLVENLQQKNKDLRQFAFIVSHDLRAPIAKIQGLAALFERNDKAGDLNGRIIENMVNELGSLDQVVKDLTDIISVREVDDKPKEEVSFVTELEQVQMTLSEEITEANVVVSVDFSQASSIKSIRSYVHSIILNLFSNAIKYRSPERPLRIKISTMLQDGFVCLRLTDNGIGINLSKYGSKLFTLYKRFHDQFHGRGIGLYLVKTQIESLGGKVEVMSTENEGTTFTVYFPNR